MYVYLSWIILANQGQRLRTPEFIRHVQNPARIDFAIATDDFSQERLEAPPGFEPGMEVLQITEGWLCC